MLNLTGNEAVDLQELFPLEIAEENIGGRGEGVGQLPHACQKRGSDAATALRRIGCNRVQVNGIRSDLPVGESDDLVRGGSHHHTAPQQPPRQDRRREFSQHQPADRLGSKQPLVGRPMGSFGDAADSQQVLPGTLADDHAAKLLLAAATRRQESPYTRFVDPLLITAAGLGVLVLLTSLLWLRARHGRRGARRSTVELGSELRAARASIDSLRIGEREAAWAATATAQRLDRSMVALGKAEHEVDRLGADLDDLRARLGAADRELAGLRADYDEASTRIAVLEGDLERAQRVEADVERDLESIEDLKQRLAAAVAERDELNATAQQVSQLQSQLSAMDRAHQDLQTELAQLRSQRAERQVEPSPDPSPSREVADRLIASEAARRDLESQLAGLTAARSAERKASRDRIASLEQLHGRIGESDRRIAELEAELEGKSVVDPQITASTYAEWDHMMRTRIASSVAEATTRLKDQVAHLRTVIVEKERHLQERGRTRPVATGPVPVTAIKGIGPVIAGILAKHGITSVAEIAALSDDDIDRLGAFMPVYPDRIRGDNWVEQARALLA